MSFAKQIASAVSLGAALLTTSFLSAPSAQASFIVTLEQQGPNVVANGSGPIDLTGLTDGLLDGFNTANIEPVNGQTLIGPNSSFQLEQFGGAIGPTSFGSGDFIVPNSGTGDVVGVCCGVTLVVPVGYMSGSALSDTSTYDNATFASLGVTPGTYEWTWGTGANQNFTLIIGPTAVPERSSFLLLAPLLGLVKLLAARHHRDISGCRCALFSMLH